MFMVTSYEEFKNVCPAQRWVNARAGNCVLEIAADECMNEKEIAAFRRAARKDGWKTRYELGSLYLF